VGEGESAGVGLRRGGRKGAMVICCCRAMEQGGESCACGRGGRREWRLGGRSNFPNWQGEALLFIEES
jgi:hypothetical protein